MAKKILVGLGVFIGLLVVAVAIYLNVGIKSWKDGVEGAAQGVDENGYPWIGAQNPVLTIHEYLDYDCPHCPRNHRVLRRHLADKLDKVRLVRHDYARMKCMPNDATIKNSRCELVRGAICASKKISFWTWNDAIIENPRTELQMPEYPEYLPKKVKTLNLDEAEFNACLFESTTIGRAQEIYKDTKRAKVSGTPTYIVDGEQLGFSELVKRIDAL